MSDFKKIELINEIIKLYYEEGEFCEGCLSDKAVIDLIKLIVGDSNVNKG